MNYKRFISECSARRVESKQQTFPKLYAAAPPGTVFMGGGMPNMETFPFSKFNVELKDGTNFSIQGKQVEDALQYQPSPGYPPLVNQMKEMLTQLHSLDSQFWETRDLLVTTGSQDAISRVFEMCLEVGDPILFAEPSFSAITDALRSLKPRYIAVGQDEFGICPQILKAALAAEGSPEEIRSRNSSVPKVLYLNPTGSNPSGTTIPTERKREIYRLACEYDFLILEDDPYYLVHFLETLPVSFLSMDTEGRVIRFDSFSKIVSAGLRIGFVTAAVPLIERLLYHIQSSTMHSSGLTQVIVSKLLDEWGSEKFNQHVQFVQDFYRKQRDHMVTAVTKHLTGLAKWTVPTGGMFMWIRVLGIPDVRPLLGDTGAGRGVLALSGHQLMVNPEAPCPYFRASYTTATAEEFDLGFSRLAEIIKEELLKQKK